MILNMKWYSKLTQVYNLNRYLSKMPNHTGKVAVVTGSSSGIGMETALMLSRSGFHMSLLQGGG
jgi:hypothetical protein